MTGQELWTLFLGAGVPTEQLKTLGYDLYYQKATAEGDASYAVEALAGKLGMSPKFAYEAFKRAAAVFESGTLGGDRRKALEWLAHDYKGASPWPATGPMTQAFINAAAHNVDVIRTALAKTAGPPPPPAGGAKPVAAFFVGGTLLSLFLSFVNARRPMRVRMA